MRHAAAFQVPANDVAEAASDEDALDVGGVYAWRVGGERHLWSPQTVGEPAEGGSPAGRARLRATTRAPINEQGDSPFTLRGCWDFVATRPPVPLEEVEPAAHIVRRFSTGAMSFGSISKEAHENLAIAMNRIGGRSNTGEGGEDEARFSRWRTATSSEARSSRSRARASASRRTTS